MKTLLKLTLFLLLAVNGIETYESHAQCGAGYTQVATNWDWQYFDTLPASSFRFAFGKSGIQYKWGGGVNTFYGTDGNNTGEASSYGTGNDLKFLKNNAAKDTIIFDNEVSSVKFSLYDIDNSQGVAITAKNAAGTALNITFSVVSGSGVVVSNSGTTTPSCTSAGMKSNTDNKAMLNVDIAGPVKTIYLSYTRTGGSASSGDTICVSDISACLTNSIANWTTNYQAVSTPQAGQPTYTLATYNNNIYVVDITNNTSSILYTDPAFTSINSLAYDPTREVIYYCNNTRSATNKSIYKYDIVTNTKSTFIADVTTLGIQVRAVTGSGMGSAGACYNDGALYIATDANVTVGDATTIWRIDIDSATQTATKASRFMSRLALPNISTRLFDWSDFVMKGGVAYCFNQSNPTPTKFGAFHLSMNLQDTLAGYTTSSVRVQAAMDYAGNVYHLGNYGSLERYNENGTFTSLGTYTRVNAADSLVTDGAESFKYPYDFGRDTANYGTAYNKYNPANNLRLGSTATYFATNPLDGTTTADNDGVASFNSLRQGDASYSVNVAVYNNTGATTYLYAYVDFNGDGDFNDAGETSTQVAIAPGQTSATVNWSALVPNGFVGNSFLRLRIAPSPGEAGSPSGYGSNGETEDYPIIIMANTLPVEMIRFTAKKIEDNSVQLDWTTASEYNNDYFEVQRSTNAKTWETIGKVKGNGNSHKLISYTFPDKNPYTGQNYYRLKQVDFSKKADFSAVVTVKIEAEEKQPENSISQNSFTLYPNPAKEEFWIRSERDFSETGTASVEIYNLSGDMINTEPLEGNLHRVDLRDQPNGLYLVKLGTQTYKVFKN